MKYIFVKLSLTIMMSEKIQVIKEYFKLYSVHFCREPLGRHPITRLYVNILAWCLQVLHRRLCDMGSKYIDCND